MCGRRSKYLIAAQQVLARYFPAGSGEPVGMISTASSEAEVRNALAATPGVATVTLPVTKDGLSFLQATMIPLILGVVLIILGLLLRAIVAPLMLIATVVLSFGAALGISALFFKHVFGFAGADTSVSLFVLVFLVALASTTTSS